MYCNVLLPGGIIRKYTVTCTGHFTANLKHAVLWAKVLLPGGIIRKYTVTWTGHFTANLKHAVLWANTK